MELQQQVKNFYATLQQSRSSGPSFKSADKPSSEHSKSLQVLSNEEDVAYHATLRTVTHDGNKGPRLPPQQTRKHPGYIRNELGGFFTS